MPLHSSHIPAPPHKTLYSETHCRSRLITSTYSPLLCGGPSQVDFHPAPLLYLPSQMSPAPSCCLTPWSGFIPHVLEGDTPFAPGGPPGQPPGAPLPHTPFCRCCSALGHSPQPSAPLPALWTTTLNQVAFSSTHRTISPVCYLNCSVFQRTYHCMKLYYFYLSAVFLLECKYHINISCYAFDFFFSFSI